jgi:hypothetical protein
LIFTKEIAKKALRSLLAVDAPDAGRRPVPQHPQHQQHEARHGSRRARFFRVVEFYGQAGAKMR